MKSSSSQQALLWTVIASTVTTSCMAMCGTRAFVAPGFAQIDKETGVVRCPRPVCNGISQLEPCDDANRRKLHEINTGKKKNAADGHERKLQTLGPTSPPNKSRETVLDGAVELVASVADTVTEATFALYDPAKDETTELTASVEAGSIVGGVATVQVMNLYLIPNDEAWQWTVKVDGVQVGDTSTFFYGPSDIVTKSGGAGFVDEAEYNYGGDIVEAVGRIYFSANDFGTTFAYDYVCSGTAIRDNKTGRSIILTAAHCIWEQHYAQQFSFNAIFIPNRDLDPELDGSNINRECQDDPCGCWQLSGGVVPEQWTTIPFPYNLPWDYGFYVVQDSGKHSGTVCNDSTALDVAVKEGELELPGEDSLLNQESISLGYSEEYNPDLRYCGGDIVKEIVKSGEPEETLWIDNCRLSGGSSGGPWLVDFDTTTGSGTIVSVNSWGRGTNPGMGGPSIDPSEGRCLMNFARELDIATMESASINERGYSVNCADRACVHPSEANTRRGLRALHGGRKLCQH